VICAFGGGGVKIVEIELQCTECKKIKTKIPKMSIQLLITNRRIASSSADLEGFTCLIDVGRSVLVTENGRLIM
jgi:hypothetical protein